jgi:tryptophan synthase beta chain
MAPLVCQGIVEGLFKPRAVAQLKCYESAMVWAKTEGTICAPETSHAIAAVIDEANKCRESGEQKVILFNYSGHGLMDLSGYDAYLSGKLTDYVLPEEEIQKNLQALKGMPKAEARKTGRW